MILIDQFKPTKTIEFKWKTAIIRKHKDTITIPANGNSKNRK